MAVPSVLKSIPTIEGDPEHQAATANLRRLAATLAEVEQQERVAMGRRTRASGTDRHDVVRLDEGVREAAKEAAVAAALAGGPMPAPPITTAELERLSFEAAALREAVCRQSEVVAEIERCVVGRIREVVTPVDRRNVAIVVERAQALADALDQALNFRRELELRRVSTGIWPHLFWFARAVGSKNEYDSPVDRLARAVATHIGQALAAGK